jgi:mycothiol synthase
MQQHLPDGIALRTPRTNELDAILRLAAQCETAVCGSPDPAMLEGVRVTWQKADFDPARDAVLAVMASGQIVGYAHVGANTPEQQYMFACVHPTVTGRGIGSALLSFAEARVGERTVTVPPRARVTLSQWLDGPNEAAHTLLAAAGYRAARHIWGMEITLGDMSPQAARMPQGLHVRACATEADLRAAYAAMEEAFQDHWSYAPRSFEQFSRSMIDVDSFDASLWFLALDGDEVAGIALGEILPDRGWVNELGVRRPWRRHGLGIALLRHAFGEFHRREPARGGPRRGLREPDWGHTGLRTCRDEHGAPVRYLREGVAIIPRLNTFHSTSFRVE